MRRRLVRQLRHVLIHVAHDDRRADAMPGTSSPASARRNSRTNCDLPTPLRPSTDDAVLLEDVQLADTEQQSLVWRPHATSASASSTFACVPRLDSRMSPTVPHGPRPSDCSIASARSRQLLGLLQQQIAAAVDADIASAGRRCGADGPPPAYRVASFASCAASSSASRCRARRVRMRVNPRRARAAGTTSGSVQSSRNCRSWLAITIGTPGP